MASDDTASVVQLHQATSKSSSERGKAFRQRQRQKSGVRSARVIQPIEKPATFANGDPMFAELERTTAELMAACKRGMDAARSFAVARRSERLLISLTDEPGSNTIGRIMHNGVK